MAVQRAVFVEMFQAPGLYLMDEPEAALSFASCLKLLGLMHDLGRSGAQVVCATHSPVLAATPGADIIEVGEHGYRRAKWDELELTSHWRRSARSQLPYSLADLLAEGTAA